MSAFGKGFAMNRTEPAADQAPKIQDQVTIPQKFAAEYKALGDFYEQVIKGNKGNSSTSMVRKPSTFALKMKKELGGFVSQESAIQDDMWDYEEEEVEINGEEAYISL
jgi:hypothetical protein